MKRYTPPKKEFLMLPNSVFDMPLDVYAFKIYAYLVCCAGSRGECWPTIHKMSTKLGIAMSTVQDRISLLEKRKLIAVKKHKGTGKYKKAVMELPPDVEIATSETNRESNDDEPIQIRPRFHEEEPVLKIPLNPDSPPVVVHHKEQSPHNTMATAKGIIGALARLIGDKCMAHRQALQGQIDHRLKQQINEKKLAMGLKIQSTQKASYQTEEEYEQSM